MATTGDKLYVDGGPSTTGTVGHLRMEGREVFKHAVAMISDVHRSGLRAGRDFGAPAGHSTGLSPTRRTRPTSRIIDASGQGQPWHRAPNKVVITGRTGACQRHKLMYRRTSGPLALHAAVADGRIKKGDLVLLEAMGGGFTWGAVILPMVNAT